MAPIVSPWPGSSHKADRWISTPPSVPSSGSHWLIKFWNKSDFDFPENILLVFSVINFSLLKSLLQE